jgi:UDP-N-acetylmuramate dehydrogenase
MDLPQVKGKLEKNYPLKKLNTWKTGGWAELVFWPAATGELVEMVGWCQAQQIPALVLGCGSNVLLPDRGLQGLVMVNTGLNKVAWDEDGVKAEAGTSLMRLAREAAARGLQGLQFACGIPGTVGAAVAANAGAYGETIGKLVQKVRVLTPAGKIETLAGREIDFAYRRSSLQTKNYLVLASVLRLEPGGDSTAMQATIKALMAKRKMTQPLEYPNAGSVFRNPPGDSAGRLIEAAGWKGRKVGDAEVSAKHANFIVNKGNARSEDIFRLIQDIQADILLKYGITLETEVRVIPG